MSAHCFDSSAPSLLLLGGITGLALGCARPAAPVEPAPAPDGSLLRSVVENHADGVHQSWAGVHSAAVELERAVQLLVEAPSEEAPVSAALPQFPKMLTYNGKPLSVIIKPPSPHPSTNPIIRI